MARNWATGAGFDAVLLGSSRGLKSGEGVWLAVELMLEGAHKAMLGERPVDSEEDMSDSDSCDQRTGDCLKCLYNTAGLKCEECAPWHYGEPVGLTRNCRVCTCDK